MVKIKIQHKEVDAWNSYDFVRYFKAKYESTYGTSFILNYEKDCILMSRVLKMFNTLDKPKSLILKFIDWAFENIKAKNAIEVNKVSIGFLPYLVPEYLEDFKSCRRE